MRVLDQLAPGDLYFGRAPNVTAARYCRSYENYGYYTSVLSRITVAIPTTVHYATAAQ